MRAFMTAAKINRCLVTHTRSLSLQLRWMTTDPFDDLHNIPGQDEILGIYTPVTKRLWVERKQREKASLGLDLPLVPPKPVPPRPITITYPFSSSYTLTEQYRNAWGYVRMGKLLEDLDSLAGNIAFQHCHDDDNISRAPILVTASVDAINLKHRLSLENDLTVTGKVVWTGKSSMDICMELRQAQYGNDRSLMALFTFVARDPITHKAMPINPVVPSTPEEKQLFAERQRISDERRAQRKKEQAASADTRAPHAAQVWADKLLAAGRSLIDLPALSEGSSVLIKRTAAQNTFIAQPQQRNLSGRVFGGFLMRRAFELSFSAAYLFAGYRPVFVSVDDITFVQPVDVGNLLRFRAHVLHTETVAAQGKGFVHVEVVASVTKPEERYSCITNTFSFVYSVALADCPTSEGCRQLKRVLPASQEEARSLWKYCPHDGSDVSPVLEKTGVLATGT